MKILKVFLEKPKKVFLHKSLAKSWMGTWEKHKSKGGIKKKAMNKIKAKRKMLWR
jgi:hypothetical protein